MLDVTTGSLTIDSLQLTIGPSFSRTDLLATGCPAETVIANEPYHSYSLGEQTVGGARFFIVLFFRGDILERVGMAHGAKEFGTSWADWSLESEVRRKEWHDAWLIKQTGRASSEYAWGSISSYYDSRSGGSEIAIIYDSDVRPAA